MTTEKSVIQGAPLASSGQKTVASRYVIEERVGWGAFYEVFRGLDTESGETVAIKQARAPAAEAPEWDELLFDEGQLLRELNHPNIVRVLATNRNDRGVYLILEYLEGGSLRDTIYRSRPLSIERILEIGLDLVDALTRAHRLNIVHQDLKPSNIVLAADGTPKIADFALSYGPTTQKLLNQGIMVGTLPYLSPEELAGEPASILGNIWSFGVILFEMLACRLPFSGSTIEEIQDAISRKPLPDMERFHPGCPPLFKRLIVKMLEPDLERRLPSMRLVSAELEAILRASRSILSEQLPGSVRAEVQVGLPEIIGDQFVCQGLLAEGGHSEVYFGLDNLTGQRIAIKRLKPQLIVRSPGLVARFKQEGDVLKKLDHPNIVKVLATFVMEGEYLIIMEYISGGDLDDLISVRKRLPMARALKIGLELADALARTHHLDIVHRDLKPSNVLIAEDGLPRLTDFGLARLMNDEVRLTQSGTTLGSPLYMSPEAWRGESVDFRADIWSLGIIIFEMIAGRTPFAGDHITEVLGKILSSPLPDIDLFCADVTQDLKVLLSEMLVKSPEHRLASVREVAARLERIKSAL